MTSPPLSDGAGSSNRILFLPHCIPPLNEPKINILLPLFFLVKIYHIVRRIRPISWFFLESFLGWGTVSQVPWSSSLRNMLIGQYFSSFWRHPESSDWLRINSRLFHSKIYLNKWIWWITSKPWLPSTLLQTPSSRLLPSFYFIHRPRQSKENNSCRHVPAVELY